MRQRSCGDEWTRRTVPITEDQQELIHVAIHVACEFTESDIFCHDLIMGCGHIGWDWFHPMTLWVVGAYANVFPWIYTPTDILEYEWPIMFTEPQFALKHSKLDFFWNDADLVGLATRRAKLPGIRRRIGRPGLAPFRHF